MKIKPIAKWLQWRSPRPAGVVVDTVVMHATAGSTFTGALGALIARECSYHFAIEDEAEEDGLIRKLIPLDRCAWHAGKSFGPQGANVNRYSVGISFVNRNDGHDPYSRAQYDAAVELVREVKKQFPQLKYVTTHAIVSPGRKTDPLNFPIRIFAVDCELELWTP